MQNPFEDDTKSGVTVFVGCWIFTVIVGVTLILRFAVKAWIHWVLPDGFEPEGHWSLEDLLLVISYPIDILHMTGVELGFRWGLGWPYDSLDPEQQVQSMRYGYISQPFGTIAAMLSRMAAACTVLTAFGMNGTQTRFIVIGFMIFQAITNTVSVLQLVLQCGPSPYRPANRVQYFHYMWDYLPTDGSVQCQALSIQTDISRVQGGVNGVMDFCLAAAVMLDLWIMVSHVFKQHQGMPVWSRLRRARRTIQPGQVWMLLAFSGPLAFAGGASIVKIYKYQDFEFDFTYNAIGNVLWTKLENYTLVLATCAPLARLFLKTLIDQYHEAQIAYHNEKPNSNNISVTQRHIPTRPVNRAMNPNPNPGRRTTWVPPYFQRYESRVSQSSLPPQVHDGFVTVQTDIVVEVDKRRPKSRSMSWFLRDTDSFKNTQVR